MSLPAGVHCSPLPPSVEEYRALRVLAGLSPKTAEAAARGLPNTVLA